MDDSQHLKLLFEKETLEELPTCLDVQVRKSTGRKHKVTQL